MIQKKDDIRYLETDQLFYRARILYIEDDIGLGRLLKKRLERMACMVDVARDGATGLETFSNGTYDVVIADYYMPGVSGLEVLQRLKDVVPVIILTGQGDEKLAVEAMKLGAADYVSKDIDGKYIELLPATIDRVMEKQQLVQEKKQIQTKLLASEIRYRAIVENQTELICRFQNDGNLTFVNAAFCHYFGVKQSDIAFQNLVDILSKKTYQQLKETIKTLTPQKSVVMNTQKLIAVDGKIHWLHWTCRAIFDDSRMVNEYQMVGRDITEVKMREEALRGSEENNMALLNAIPDQVLQIDQQGICIDIRPKKDQVLVLASENIGKNIADIFPIDLVAVLQYHLHKVFLGETPQTFQFDLRQGEQVSYYEARMVLAGGKVALTVLRDITERSNLEKQLIYCSEHDSLTGLYNRAFFAEAVRRISGSCQPVGIVICSIDGLKIVNRELGYYRGDDLIKAAADVVFRAFHCAGTVARIGGDEFAVLMPDVTSQAIEEACSLLCRLENEYNKSHPEFSFSLSVGTAISNNENSELWEVFQKADSAMGINKLSNKKIRCCLR